MTTKVVHWELMGSDGGAMVDFYRGIFGWKTQAPEGFDTYHMVDREEAGVGGAVGQGSEEMPSYVTIYLEVPSIDEYLGKIEAAGGTTVMPRTVLPGMVTYALFTDPGGNIVGLVEGDVPQAD